QRRSGGLVAGPRGQRLDRLGRGRRLGEPARGSLPSPEDLAVDDHLDPEQLVVVRTDGVEQAVDGSPAGRPLGVLLEPALRALQRADRRVELDLRAGQLDEPVPGPLPAEIEVDRPHDRLERGGEERRATPAAALCLALAEAEVLAEVETAGEASQAGGR